MRSEADAISLTCNPLTSSPLSRMSAARQLHYISVEDYLTGEQLSEVRHEYNSGQVTAMAGASRNHGQVAGSLFNRLFSHLRGRPCDVFQADMKVRVLAHGRDVFYYPDIVVGCDPRDTDDFFLRFPKLIIEVLSPSTERLDRLEKFSLYRTIPTLEEYVLVAQDVAEVTVFRRRMDWQGEVFSGLDSEVTLESVELTVGLATIYEKVRGVETKAL